MHEVLIANPGSNMLMQMVDGFCVNPLHSNWSIAGFKGMALRSVLWAIAKAITAAQFASRMEEMAEINLDAAKWFDNKPAAYWSRSHFSTTPSSLIEIVADANCLSLLGIPCPHAIAATWMDMGEPLDSVDSFYKV
ncbi:hypothetical protein ACH5RR_029620 [Cinchona calisaya]|uniref:SWIM-type domain-containing protein n=1 Tax=Cinchona calisaya TaxID=153742 RepID=A0ABD2YVG7_9GENT